MAACGSLQQIFDNPLPETTPSLLESLSSWKPFDPFEDASLKDNEASIVSGYSSKRSKGFRSMNSESLQLCTEGLGFESLDGVEDFKNEATTNASLDSTSEEARMDNTPVRGRSTSYIGSEQYYRRGKSGVRSFPPPISSLGRRGKPSVCFKSYRHDGRFVLQEVKIPAQQYLHASREDGRLRLSFVQPEDEESGDDDGNEEEEIDVIDRGECEGFIGVYKAFDRGYERLKQRCTFSLKVSTVNKRMKRSEMDTDCKDDKDNENDTKNGYTVTANF